MKTELVGIHECVKDKDHVVIVAKKIDNNRGGFIVLTAHSPKCKEAK